MSKIKVGSTVIHEGAVWRVTEFTESNLGTPVAQIECLDKDAFAAVAVDGLATIGLADDQVEERVASRESHMLPIRIASMRRLFAKQIKRAEEAKTKAELAMAKAELAGAEAAAVADDVAMALFAAEAATAVAEAATATAKGEYLTGELAKFNEGVSHV